MVSGCNAPFSYSCICCSAALIRLCVPPQFADWCMNYGKHGCRTPDTPFSLFEGKMSQFTKILAFWRGVKIPALGLCFQAWPAPSISWPTFCSRRRRDFRRLRCEIFLRSEILAPNPTESGIASPGRYRVSFLYFSVIASLSSMNLEGERFFCFFDLICCSYCVLGTDRKLISRLSQHQIA